MHNGGAQWAQLFSANGFWLNRGRGAKEKLAIVADVVCVLCVSASISRI